MLLSLRSNPQTMKPYIQEMMVCAPGQSITCLLPIVLHMEVLLCSRIDVYLWVIDQCHAKYWGPCISTGSYYPKVYLWLSEAYWRELPCAHGSKHLHLAVPKISANQCPALINWYLNEYWLLRHVLGIIWKFFLRAFSSILDHGDHTSICGDMAEWSLWHLYYW